MYYFISAASIGYSLISESSFMPRLLGGDGNYANAIINDKDNIDYLKEYYLVECTYYLGRIVIILNNSYKSDFIEMLFHHILIL